MQELLTAFSYGFLQRALLAGLAIGCAAPVVGAFVVVRRQSLLADTLAHASLAGVAIGAALGIASIWSAFAAAVIAALLIEFLRMRGRMPREATLAMVLSGSLALALVVLQWSNGAGGSLLGYLFGSITTITADELLTMTVVSAGSIAMMLVGFGRFTLFSFDDDLAASQGHRIGVISFFMTLAVAALVAVSIRVVGVLLMGSLMVVPVIAALQLRWGWRATVAASVVVALCAVVAGLSFSYLFDLPAGPAIALCALSGVVLLRGIRYTFRVWHRTSR